MKKIIARVGGELCKRACSVTRLPACRVWFTQTSRPNLAREFLERREIVDWALHFGKTRGLRNFELADLANGQDGDEVGVLFS